MSAYEDYRKSEDDFDDFEDSWLDEDEGDWGFSKPAPDFGNALGGGATTKRGAPKNTDRITASNEKDPDFVLGEDLGEDDYTLDDMHDEPDSRDGDKNAGPILALGDDEELYDDELDDYEDFEDYDYDEDEEEDDDEEIIDLSLDEGQVITDLTIDSSDVDDDVEYEDEDYLEDEDPFEDLADEEEEEDSDYVSDLDDFDEQELDIDEDGHEDTEDSLDNPSGLESAAAVGPGAGTVGTLEGEMGNGSGQGEGKKKGKRLTTPSLKKPNLDADKILAPYDKFSAAFAGVVAKAPVIGPKIAEKITTKGKARALPLVLIAAIVGILVFASFFSAPSSSVSVSLPDRGKASVSLESIEGATATVKVENEAGVTIPISETLLVKTYKPSMNPLSLATFKEVGKCTLKNVPMPAVGEEDEVQIPCELSDNTGMRTGLELAEEESAKK